MSYDTYKNLHKYNADVAYLLHFNHKYCISVIFCIQFGKLFSKITLKQFLKKTNKIDEGVRFTGQIPDTFFL